MSFFDRLFGRKPTDPDQIPDEMPWDRHPSIYEHVAAHVNSDQPGLSADGYELPDESRVNAEGTVGFAIGALDGIMSHHGGGESEEAAVRAATQIIRAYCDQPTAVNKAAFYSSLLDGSTLGVVDPVLQGLIEDPAVNHQRLYEVAYSFATQAIDREPVKFGIALLGIYNVPENEQLFQTLGRHDEFTLYCAVALMNSSDNPEQALWKLAQNVDGWGRIQAVERLAETQDPEIKDWLLREGFRNSIMIEYLAYTCATTGGLLSALSQEQIDRELLTAAGEILAALFEGGPAEDIDSYADGALATEMYLGHAESVELTLADYINVLTIQHWLKQEDADWEMRVGMQWTPERVAELRNICEQLLSRPDCREKALRGLSAEDRMEFHYANAVAEALGVDTWEAHWRRLRECPDDDDRWYHMMVRCDESRIDEVVAYAERTLDLHALAIGPAEELGLGREWQPHQCLNYVLQELGKFPGRGKALIQAGLQSPLIPTRNATLRALSAWGQYTWGEELTQALQAAAAIEPDEEVRQRMERILRGEGWEE
ncbi:limonene hydroxylase [Blastopirellula marina]|uniref:Limonene hydroxylase n=1 Tax=Blastopirellula marina TaxID=124 RepID=A0A2S8GM09_9BACT|nr:limonene hydroxylase [Blastopirellula marina]PQO45468.1 limonene hydroxylase [Blastopirellula marina]